MIKRKALLVKKDRRKAPFTIPSADGKPFRRYSGLPLEARFTLKVSVHSGRRPAAGAKGGKGTKWFPCPLLTPPNPPLR